MKMTNADQLKARIKNLATEYEVDPRVLLRIYMMERFLARLSKSPYQDKFILKGGMLISYLIGVDQRTTMDVDATLRNTPLTPETIRTIVSEVINIDDEDGVTFQILRLEEIMHGDEYPGIRIHLNALFDNTVTPVKIDISTGHDITPEPFEKELSLMFAEPIQTLVYPTEMVIAEKLQTVLSRATFNTRMRDFYDLFALRTVLGKSTTKSQDLQRAFEATMASRQTLHLEKEYESTIKALADDQNMKRLWQNYSRTNRWARHLTWDKIVNNVAELLRIVIEQRK